MSFESMAYTDAGISMLLDAAAGKRLTITKAVSGTSAIAPSALAHQIDVSGAKHTLELLGISAVGQGEEEARHIKIRIPSAANTYTLRQIGIFGRQDNSDDTLLMLIQDERGVEIPAATENQEFELIFTAVLAISRSAKIALALNADMRGLKIFIRQEIHDNTAHAKIVDITIPAASWKQEDAAAEYGYTALIQLEGVTAEQSPSVTIHREHTAAAQTAALCPMAETDSGVLKLWAKHIPRADMTATVLLVSPKSVDTLEPLPEEPTINTTSLLGTAICGNAICGMV
nr:MAG TPA_asm: tail-collar fiber protein [Caudoviricetes sp.]